MVDRSPQRKAFITRAQLREFFARRLHRPRLAPLGERLIREILNRLAAAKTPNAPRRMGGFWSPHARRNLATRKRALRDPKILRKTRYIAPAEKRRGDGRRKKKRGVMPLSAESKKKIGTLQLPNRNGVSIFITELLARFIP